MSSIVAPEIRASIKKLQQAGLYLDAWELTKNLPPPEEWTDVAARLDVATLIGRLGDPKRESRMVLKAWRDPQNRPAAREGMFWEVVVNRGDYLAWQWLQKNVPGAGESAERQADHHSRLAVVLMKMRDFERAAEALERACALQPEERYLTLLKADLLLQRGSQEEALDLVQEVIEAEPDYVAAIDMAADILVDLGDDEAALELLQRSMKVVQAGSLARSLANLQMQLKQYEDVAGTLSIYERLMPLKDQACLDWVAGMRCDLASRQLDLPAALHWARQVAEDGFHSRLVPRLKANPAAGWHPVLLPVPDIQENDLTSGPAALATLAAFWEEEVADVELADEVCYDGTPPYKDREWAEAAGWAVRVFKVTVESARTLIDAGMPFVLNTVEGGMGRSQVVAGYDDRRTVFFVFDPADPSNDEFLASESLEKQAPYGPRGLVMVPTAHRSALAALDLPESEAWHLLHQLMAALAGNDSGAAAKALRSLHSRHPGHVLFWRGELEMARHDGDLPRQMTALEALLEMHPGVEHWQTSRLSLIDKLQGREALVHHLTSLCAQPEGHISHQLMLLQILRRNDQHLPEARRLLRRLLRQQLMHAEAIFCEAALLAKSQRHEEALELFRLASCLESGDEEYAMAYFDAARLLQREEEALHHLRQRFEDEGGRSSQPGTTLYQALEKLNQIQEALAVLDQSLALNEDDADHAVYVAGEMVAWNRLDRARELLASVTRAARAASWHRVQAHLAAVMGDGVAELKHQRAVLKDSPQDVRAHRAIATLLDVQDGRPKGLKFLQKACSQHSFQWDLHLAWLDWAREAGTKESEKVVRELLRIDPQDAWALRELADILSDQKRYEEAHAELDKAAEIDSQDVSQLTVRGGVLEREGRLLEAREFFSQAVCTDVDKVYALEALIRLSPDDEQRLQGLRVIQRELRRQVIQGDAVPKFTLLARPLMDPAELGQTLGELHARRPDLWQTASCYGDHLRQTGRAEEAVAVTAEAVRRFGRLPRVWMDHSQNLEAAGRRAEGIEAAANIRLLNPGWAGGMRHLSEMLRNERRYQEAREVLEESLRKDSQDPLTHGWLAEVFWDLQEQEGALHHIARAVELSPDYGWAWDMLSRWSKAAGKTEALRQALEKLQTQRPDDAGTWKMTARRLNAPEDLPARLAALDKAISLDPASLDAVDLKAQILGDAGRFDEALAVCRSHPSQSLELRHREGWLLRLKGRNAEAVEVIQAAVSVDPSFEWPWRLLAIWHEKDGRLDAAEEACRTLIRLEPDNAGHFSRLGGVLVAQMRHPEARTAYAEAWSKAPQDEHSFQRLFWLRIDDEDWSDTAALLRAAEGRFTEIHLQSLWFVLHCRERHWKKAGESLDRMLAHPSADADAMERVHEELRLLPEEVFRKQLRVHETQLLAHLTRDSIRNPGCAKLYGQICVLLNKKPDPALVRTV